jgi:sortase A
MRNRILTVLRWLSVAVGLLLIAAGLREVIESRTGQAEVAATWDSLSEAPEQPAERQTTPPQGPFARLSIPRLHTDLLVVSGTGKSDLRKGPGHLRGTAFPGASGNSVIAGHRDTHFRVLKDIRVGDRIVIQTSRGDFAYDVKRTLVVPATERGVLLPTSDPTLTLVTCFPFYYVGPAPQRYIVQAKLVSMGRLELPNLRVASAAASADLKPMESHQQ